MSFHSNHRVQYTKIDGDAGKSFDRLRDVSGQREKFRAIGLVATVAVKVFASYHISLSAI